MNAIAQCNQTSVCSNYCFPLFCGQVLIGQGQGCSCNFFLSSDVLLVDDYLCDIISHDNHAVFILVFCVYCDGTVLFNRKGEIFSIRITIRSVLFVERVSLIRSQLAADVMRCAIRCPFFDDIIVFILYLESCSQDFVLTSNIPLVNGYFQCLVLHDNDTVFILVFCVYCDRAILFNRKGEIFSIRITSRSTIFMECIGLASNQLAADVTRCTIGCPFFDDIALFILYLESCSQDFISISNIPLVNGYFQCLVIHDNDTVFILVCCVYCDRAVLFNRKGDIFGICIASRSSSFFQRIGLASNQLAADVTRCTIGCPFFDDIIVFILYLESCSQDFISTSNISLVNGYFQCLVLHDNDTVFILVCCIYCDRAVLFNRKGDIFGICIAIRSSSFFQRISSSRQTNNILCSIAGCPLNTVAHCCQICVCSSNCLPLFCGQVIIGQGQGCSCNFVFASDVSLVNLNTNTFILDGQNRSIFGLFDFAICRLIYGRYNTVLHDKCKGGNRLKSVRSSDFF